MIIQKIKIARDAITGKFVSIKYAWENPTTTVIETILLKRKRPAKPLPLPQPQPSPSI